MSLEDRLKGLRPKAPTSSDVIQLLERQRREAREATKAGIDSSEYRRIETRPNGDRFVHDGHKGYVVDGATGQVKGWKIRPAIMGGDSTWRGAEFSERGNIGGPRDYGLHEKPPVRYK